MTPEDINTFAHSVAALLADRDSLQLEVRQLRDILEDEDEADVECPACDTPLKVARDRCVRISDEAADEHVACVRGWLTEFGQLRSRIIELESFIDSSDRGVPMIVLGEAE